MPERFHPLGDAWRDVWDRERDLGIPAGQPILVSDGLIDYRLGDYFRTAFGMGQVSTAMTYAVELRTWLAFLGTRDVSWDEAHAQDVRTFHVWRRYDERNPAPVSASTWNKGWAALRHFYGWAEREGHVERSPVAKADREPASVASGGHREKNARASRDRWLTPDDFGAWTLIGLRGYQAELDRRGRVVATVPEEAARVRNTARNTAFAKYLLVTGLRREECGTLLLLELPESLEDEPLIKGKGGFIRRYRALHHMGLEAIRDYRLGERRQAIGRAQRAGRYSRMSDALVISDVAVAGRDRRVRLTSGRLLTLHELGQAERARLLVQGESGLEPASLWLTESGMPLPPATWDKVFEAGNRRFTSVQQALGRRQSGVNVTPHSLRFTFALFLLLASIRAIDEQLGLSPVDPFRPLTYSQAFEEVRDLLGHASLETTKQTYLEPVKGLRRSSLLRGGTMADVWDSLASAAIGVGFAQDST